VAIAVFGATGVGKSSFVNTASESRELEVGHALHSETKSVAVAKVFIDGTDCFLIDTPGFNDTNKPDADVLRTIANFLAVSYRCGEHLAGVVILGRITDNRVSGSMISTIRIIEAIIGSDAMPATMLVTSMWDSQDPVTAEKREEELRRTHWASMIAHGAQVARHDGSPSSARNIVGRLLDRRRKSSEAVTLALQRQLVDERVTLSNTPAGKLLGDDIVEAMRQHETGIDHLRAAMERVREEDRQVLREELEAEQDALRRRQSELRGLNSERDEEIIAVRAAIGNRAHCEADWNVWSTIMVFASVSCFTALVLL